MSTMVWLTNGIQPTLASLGNGTGEAYCRHSTSVMELHRDSFARRSSDWRQEVCLDGGRSSGNSFTNGGTRERVDVDTSEPVGGADAVCCQVTGNTWSGVFVDFDISIVRRSGTYWSCRHIEPRFGELDTSPWSRLSIATTRSAVLRYIHSRQRTGG